MRTDVPLREITLEEIYKDVQELRSELQTHNHLDIGNAQVLTGTLNGITQSSNFVSGSSGCQINWTTGDLEANSGKFRGSVLGGQTSFNTGIGFFLGLESGAYKFSIGNPDGYYMTWDGTDLIINEKTNTIASNTLVQSNNTQQDYSSTSYTKEKETKCNRPLNGVRIKFDMKRNSAGTTAYGRIYRNGVAIGTEQSDGVSAPGTWITYSEDFNDFYLNDLIQIYGKQSGGVSGSFRNFRLYYDEPEFTSQDP